MSFRKVVVSEPGFESFTQAQSDISKMKKVDTDMRNLLHSNISDEVKIELYNKMLHMFSKLLTDFRNPGIQEPPPPPIPKPEIEEEKMAKKTPKKRKRKGRKPLLDLTSSDEDVFAQSGYDTAVATPVASSSSRPSRSVVRTPRTPGSKTSRTPVESRTPRKPVSSTISEDDAFAQSGYDTAVASTPIISTRSGRVVRKPKMFGQGKPFRVKKYKFF